MPLATYTLSGTFENIVGAPVDSNSGAWLETANTAITDPNIAIRLGPTYELPLDGSGHFTVSGLPAGVYRIHVNYLPTSSDEIQRFVSNWFPLNANLDIADPAIAAVTPLVFSVEQVGDIEAEITAVAAALNAKLAIAAADLPTMFATPTDSSGNGVWPQTRADFIATKVGVGYTGNIRYDRVTAPLTANPTDQVYGDRLRDRV